jgi:hypothetical protein
MSVALKKLNTYRCGTHTIFYQTPRRRQILRYRTTRFGGQLGAFGGIALHDLHLDASFNLFVGAIRGTDLRWRRLTDRRTMENMRNQKGSGRLAIGATLLVTT